MQDGKAKHPECKVHPGQTILDDDDRPWCKGCHAEAVCTRCGKQLMYRHLCQQCMQGDVDKGK